jgi:saccharopepsin
MSLKATVIAAAMLLAVCANAARLTLEHREHPSIDVMRDVAQQRALAMHHHALRRGLQPAGARLNDQETRTGIAPMFNNLASGMYAAQVAVGTPRQTFSVVMDTGSSNLWVPDSLCTDFAVSPSCALQNRYRNASSSTFYNGCPCSSCGLFIPYGSGTVLGTLSMDTVEVGGVVLSNTSFGRVYAEPGNVSEWGAPIFDGILGLAYPIIAMPFFSMLPGPFDEMMTRKIVPEPLFSIFLSSVENDTTSYVAFGEIPKENYEGELITVPQDLLQPELGYWCVGVNAIKVGGAVQPSTSGIIGVIDTGTSLIAGPPAVVNPIIAQINASSDCSNVHLLPNISFTFDLGWGQSHDFVLTPEQYTYRQKFSDGEPDQCECGLFAFDAGEGLLPLWILGDPFLRSYFAVFNRGTNQLKFAKSVPTK